MADRQLLQNLLQQYPSFYLYEEAGIRAAAQRLTAVFSGAQILYSVKCNPYTQVLNTIFPAGFGADAASLGEVEAAERHGVSKEQIYFSAPARTEADLRAAWGRCTLIADSLHEIDLIRRIGGERGEVPEIGDGLAMTNAGCYASVMTPMQFASLTPPSQLFLTADGQIICADAL